MSDRQTKPCVGKDVAAILANELAELDEQQVRAVLAFSSLLKAGLPIQAFFRLIADAFEGESVTGQQDRNAEGAT